MQPQATRLLGPTPTEHNGACQRHGQRWILPLLTAEDAKAGIPEHRLRACVAVRPSLQGSQGSRPATAAEICDGRTFPASSDAGLRSLIHAGLNQQSKGLIAPDEPTAAETPKFGSGRGHEWTIQVRFWLKARIIEGSEPNLALPGAPGLEHFCTITSEAKLLASLAQLLKAVESC